MKERFEIFTVLINRINRNIRKIKNQEMAEYGLRSAHISCLYYLYLSKSLTATELCEKCEEDKATISRALDFLEKNDYLSCRSNNPRRYKASLFLTDKGLCAGKKIAEKADGVLNEIGAMLSSNDRESFYRSLSTISEGLDRITKKV